MKNLVLLPASAKTTYYVHYISQVEVYTKIMQLLTRQGRQIWDCQDSQTELVYLLYIYVLLNPANVPTLSYCQIKLSSIIISWLHTL